MKEQQKIPEETSYNAETRQAFRRQVVWQIYFPLVLFVLALAGLAVGFSLGHVGSFRSLADLSLVLLSIPALVIGLILLALTASLVYGITWLIKSLPVPALYVQRIFSQVESRTRSAADGAAVPFIRIKSLLAVIRSVLYRPSEGAEGEDQE